MSKCIYCGTELGTGGCPKWDCPSKISTVTLGNAPQPGHNPPAGMPTPNSAEWHWASARGFDLKAPHWDDLTPEIQEAVRRVVHNLTYVDPEALAAGRR